MYRISLCLLFFPLCALAYTKTSVSSGNWSNVATWGGSVPVAGDSVIISTGTSVNLNQTTASALAFLSVSSNGKLRVTVNGSGLHIAGNIENRGELTLWSSNSLKGSLFLHADCFLSGVGAWNLGLISLGSSQLEFEDHQVISIADNITGTSISGINSARKNTGTVFFFNGSENATIPSDSLRYFYPAITVSKTSSVSRTVTFADQAAPNTIRTLGMITLSAVTDRLAIGSNNRLDLYAGTAGKGTISGGIDSRLKLTTFALNDTLRMTPGTSFYELSVEGTGTLVCENSFVVRYRLSIAQGAKFVLPSSSTLTLGVNGITPTNGDLSCDGYLVCGTASSLTVRGAGADPVTLKFDQSSAARYSLLNLELSRVHTAGRVRLFGQSKLIINGSMELDTANVLDIAEASLILNLTVTIRPEAYLSGSPGSELSLSGSGGNATLRFNPNGDPVNRMLKSFSLDRSPGRVITLADTLYIRNTIEIVSGKLNSNGRLVLYGHENASASLAPLHTNGDLLGDVIVQCRITGGSGMRGTRMLASPVDDSGTPTGIFEQLKRSLLVTGSGGVGNGFDSGGIGQPYAQTIQFYNEPALPGQPQFTGLPDIYRRATSTAYPGKSKGFFLFFRGNRQVPERKLNSTGGTYAEPESVTVSFIGPVNKNNLVVALSYTHSPDDVYAGYNVLGNPYPSAIDWRNVSRVDVANLVAILKPGGGMVTYSDGVIVNGDGLPVIQTGQGFYTKALKVGASVTFTEACKTVSSSARLLKTGTTTSNIVESPVTDFAQLRIRIQAGEDSEETAIVFDPNAKPVKDDRDAIYFPGAIPGIASLAQGNTCAIRFIPYPADSALIGVQLSLSKGVNSRIIFNPKNLSRDYTVWILDSFAGTRSELTQETAINLPANSAESTATVKPRFALQISKRHTAKASQEFTKRPVLYPVPVVDTLYITDVNGAVAFWISVYDLSGKKRMTSREKRLDVSALEPGVYTLELRDSSNRYFRQLFLKR